MQPLDLGCQEHDRLPGRIAAADQRHLFAFAELRFDRRSPIGDAGVVEVGQIGDRRAAVARAGGDDDGVRLHGIAAVDIEAERLLDGAPPQSSRVTSSGIAISAPNFCAWLKARPASAWPEMPVGKPR